MRRKWIGVATSIPFSSRDFSRRVARVQHNEAGRCQRTVSETKGAKGRFRCQGLLTMVRILHTFAAGRQGRALFGWLERNWKTIATIAVATVVFVAVTAL